MIEFKRIFGSGFNGLIISVLLFLAAAYFKDLLKIPMICDGCFLLRVSVFTLFFTMSIIMFVWSFMSLKPGLRGKTLITRGAFSHFRHPLYAAFLTFFNFGLAVLLNNWVFIGWAIILHPVWHLLTAEEEKMLKNTFPNDYEEYCKNTGRFLPKYIFRKPRKRDA